LQSAADQTPTLAAAKETVHNIHSYTAVKLNETTMIALIVIYTAVKLK
jgi:hypothetical protein